METVTTRELTCIGCPMGCPLTVTMEAGEVKIFRKGKSLSA